jgi:hypothetical protein
MLEHSTSATGRIRQPRNLLSRSFSGHVFLVALLIALLGGSGVLFKLVQARKSFSSLTISKAGRATRAGSDQSAEHSSRNREYRRCVLHLCESTANNNSAERPHCECAASNVAAIRVIARDDVAHSHRIVNHSSAPFLMGLAAAARRKRGKSKRSKKTTRGASPPAESGNVTQRLISDEQRGRNPENRDHSAPAPAVAGATGAENTAAK